MLRKWPGENVHLAAAREFEESYLLSEAPTLLFNLGLTHQQLGHREEAVDYFERYLREVGASAPNRVNVETRIASLRAEDHDPLPTDGADDDAPNDDAPNGLRTGGIVGLSVAAVALGGAAVSGALFAVLKSELDDCQGTSLGCPPEDVDRLVRRARTFDATAAVSLAAFAVGLTLLILAPKDDESQGDGPSVRVSPWLDQETAGAQLGVSF